MKFIIIFICIITTTVGYAIEKPDIKNLILTKNLKTYEKVIFKDKNQKDVDLANYKGKLIILNFWATWCLPCKEEMPSLDNLQKKH
jgi:thiol-disulfide isomerase/thioredoxin